MTGTDSSNKVLKMDQKVLKQASTPSPPSTSSQPTPARPALNFAIFSSVKFLFVTVLGFGLVSLDGRCTKVGRWSLMSATMTPVVNVLALVLVSI